MDTTNTTKTNRNLKPGTKVVSMIDMEPGTIVGVCTFRANGQDAFTYTVDTAYGREEWEIKDTALAGSQD